MNDVLIPCSHQVIIVLSAFSFAIHMLRTEHISRNMKKENFSTLVGCEVSVLTKTQCLSRVSFFCSPCQVFWTSSVKLGVCCSSRISSHIHFQMLHRECATLAFQIMATNGVIWYGDVIALASNSLHRIILNFVLFMGRGLYYVVRYALSR